MPPADPRLSDPTFLRLMALRRKKRLALLSQEQSRAIPETDEDLWTYVCEVWGITIPRVRTCPDHVAPFTAFSDAYFARDSMLIWEASRGFGGKSYLLSILGLTIACTRGGDVNILGGSGEQSRRVHDYMAKAWNQPHAPRHLLRSDPMKTLTRLAQGNTIQALLASSTSVRGPHIPTLLLDECDEMALPIFDAAMGQTMAHPGMPAVTVISSTHHYPDGTFTEILKRATAQGWPHYCWCYRESLQPHGWLAEGEIERKRRETTAAMWDAEYELQEPSPESRAIMPEAVSAMFRRELGEYGGLVGEYIEAEPPVPEGRYAHGADWAKDQDMTEIITLRIDVLPLRVVAYERVQRRPWPQMVARLDARVQRYGGEAQSIAAHDATGVGGVVDDFLTVSAQAILMVGKTRSSLFSEYIAAIEHGQIISPMIASLEGQHRYCQVADLYGSGHPPDGVVAGAMAFRAQHVPRWLPVGE